MDHFPSPNNPFAAQKVGNQHDSRSAAARIQFDLDGLCVTPSATFQADRERVASQHDGLPRSQQVSCPRRMAGHERFSMLVYYQDPLHELPQRSRLAPVKFTSFRLMGGLFANSTGLPLRPV
jgi:hypothetical protein